jgi:drug/metabolite transporter (DMT)-like permease
MNWFTWAITGNLAIALGRVFIKIYVAKDKTINGAFTILFQLIPALTLLIIFLSIGETFPDLTLAPINWLIGAVSFSVGVVYTFKAYETTEVSNISIVSTVRIVWTMLIAYLFLGEEFTKSGILGTVLILIGVAFLFYQKGKIKVDKGFWYVMISSLGFGIGIANEPLLNQHYSALQVLSVEMLMTAFVIAAYKPSEIKFIPKVFKTIPIWAFIPGILVYTYSTYAGLAAYQAGGPMLLITPLSQLGRIFLVIFGIVIFKEKTRLPQKLIGVLLAIAGSLVIKMVDF